MTLTTGATAVSVGDEIYAYSSLIEFIAFASGAEATALDFTSPNDHYSCLVNVSLDVGSMAQNDLLAVIIRCNGENLFQAKWALLASYGATQSIYPLNVILPPNTRFKAILALSSGTAMVGSGSVILTGRRIGGR